MTNQELLDTIEEIRKKNYPNVPADLVKQIVMAEQNFIENRSEAYKRISQAIDEYLDNLSPSDNNDKG